MKTEINKIVVMGLGYIGLPTASMLATKGYTVVGVDVNPDTVETINQGKIHIVEPDLDLLVKSAVHSGNLTASLEPCEADVYIIAVPTPFQKNKNDAIKVPDISFVEAATRSIAPFLNEGNLVILESTSPVGTTERVHSVIAELRPELVQSNPNNHEPPIYIAHCPERVLPGQILRELVDNDRIIGGIDKASTQKARGLYKTFSNGQILLTDCRTAELAKLVENSFRDVNIAFANELSLICDKVGVNVWELISLANRHPRVNILQPGPGVGGHCIAVDPWFIVDAAPDLSRLIRTAREVNDFKPQWVVEKVKSRALMI
jgi:UDP-N-acetyl-D-mannosaminuronic acid dehydrogenase